MTGGVWIYGLAAAVGMGMYSLLNKLMMRYRICDAGLVTWGVMAATGVLSLGVIAAGGWWRLPAWEVLAAVVGPGLGAHLLLNYSMQEGDASTVTPLLSLKIPMAAGLSFLFLGERHGAAVYAAVVLAALGVVFFSIGRQQRAQGGHGKSPLLAVVLAGTAALAYAVTDLGARWGMMRTEPMRLAMWANVGMAVVGAVMLRRRTYRKYVVEAKDMGLFLLTGATLVAGIGTFFLAIDAAGNVTVPNVILGLRGFVALVLGMVLGRWLKTPMERQDKRIYGYRVVGACLLTAAIFFVSQE